MASVDNDYLIAENKKDYKKDKKKVLKFKKCFDKEIMNHLQSNKNLFKKDIKSITNKCLKKVKLKGV